MENKTQNEETKQENRFPWDDDHEECQKEEKEETQKPEEEYFLNDSEDEFDKYEFWEDDDPEDMYDTPQKIYDFLELHVWKQEEAKKAAAIIAYNTFYRGVKENVMFIGPTGCGKTYIWQCLKSIFPNRIEVVDGSNITQEGWKGDKKWKTIFSSPTFWSGRRSVLVIDEADKMLKPRYTSTGDNVGNEIAAEGLKLIDGINLEITRGNTRRIIDTSQISIVFCGAFSENSERVAKENKGISIGFGAQEHDEKAYDKPMGEKELISYGILPEFVGRMQRFVNLQAMTLEDYYQMTDNNFSLQSRIEEQYKAEIRLSAKKRRELAEFAFQNGLGIRGIENQIRRLMDDAIFDDCNRQCFEF